MAEIVDGIKVTDKIRRVLEVLLTGAPGLTGLEISRRASDLTVAPRVSVGNGEIYLILAELEGGEWVTSDWEVPEPLPDGRPRRRFYQLTPYGRTRANKIFGKYDLGG